jgi:hypothetical protein
MTSATVATSALVRFKLAAYTRSHRIIQPFLAVLALLIVLYSTRVPAGGELSSYTDSAAIQMIVFAWAARSLLDTEPDTQRLISMTSGGRPGREIAGGLLAATAVNLGLAAVAIAVPLLIGFSATPSAQALAGGVAIHLLSLVAGVALGALTSRAILPSPAVSLLVLLGGYAAMLLVSLSPLAWVAAVPVIGWMRAANDGDLLRRLPLFAVQTLVWSGAGLAAYLVLRRNRP